MEVCVLQGSGVNCRLFSACLLQHFGIVEVMRRAGRGSGTRQQVGTLAIEAMEWTHIGFWCYKHLLGTAGGLFIGVLISCFPY